MQLFYFLRGLLLLVFILCCCEYYPFLALRSLTENWSDGARRISVIVYVGLSVILYTTLLAGMVWRFETFSHAFRVYFQAFFFVLLISKLFLALPMLSDDVRRLVTWGFRKMNYWSTPTQHVGTSISRTRFLMQAGIALGAIPLVTLTYGILRNMYRFTIHRQDIAIKDLPEGLEGLRIVQISDIHSGTFPRVDPLRTAVDMINSQNPDIVFFTGDLVNNVATEIDPFKEVFGSIRAKYGVFSILGNHDYGDYARWNDDREKAANLARLCDAHREMGWDLMRNEHRILEINGAKLAIIGVENFSAKPQFPKHGRLGASHVGTEAADVRLLLSHDPSHWDYEINTRFRDIALTLSGHTHGFQFGIEIPGFVRWSPSQYMYPQWAGHYERDGSQLYVNRGLGCLGYPGRVGILPEITVLTLKKA